MSVFASICAIPMALSARSPDTVLSAAFYEDVTPSALLESGEQRQPHIVPSQFSTPSTSSSSNSLEPAYASYAQTHSLKSDASLHIRVVENGRTLEVRWLRTTRAESAQMNEDQDDDDEEEDESEAPVRLVFPETIVPEIAVAYDAGSEGDSQETLEILLLTLPNLAYRLRFKGRKLFHAQSYAKGWSKEQALSNVLAGRHPVLVAGIGSVSASEGFVIACSDGSLVRAEWLPEEGRHLFVSLHGWKAECRPYRYSITHQTASTSTSSASNPSSPRSAVSSPLDSARPPHPTTSARSPSPALPPAPPLRRSSP